MFIYGIKLCSLTLLHYFYISCSLININSQSFIHKYHRANSISRESQHLEGYTLVIQYTRDVLDNNIRRRRGKLQNSHNGWDTYIRRPKRKRKHKINVNVHVNYKIAIRDWTVTYVDLTVN